MPRGGKRRAAALSPGSASNPVENVNVAARRKRPRRKAAEKKEQVYQSADNGTLDFVDCQPYFPAASQPFSVTISMAAALVVDLHSHFSKREVIGYLAGAWDPKANIVRILRAFPGISTSCHHEHQNALQEAEMDPVAEVALRDEVKAAGLKIVGWYHSHPTFEPTPSYVDITNQSNYQLLFRNDEHNASPFIGMICGPYDTNMHRTASRMFYYFVEAKTRTPKRLRIGYTGIQEGTATVYVPPSNNTTKDRDDAEGDNSSSRETKPLSILFSLLNDLIKGNADAEGNIDLSTAWRAKTTHLQATIDSIRHRLSKWCNPDDVNSFCKQIHASLELYFCKK